MVKKESTLKQCAFLYSLPAIKMYEQRTGRNFFDDNQKALTAYTQLALATGVMVAYLI